MTALGINFFFFFFLNFNNNYTCVCTSSEEIHYSSTPSTMDDENFDDNKFDDTDDDDDDLNKGLHRFTEAPRRPYKYCEPPKNFFMTITVDTMHEHNYTKPLSNSVASASVSSFT